MVLQWFIMFLLVIFICSTKTQKSFCTLVGAFHSASPPKCAKGNHLTLDCESSPWAFHPRRVLRQLRREVSLSCLNRRRLAGGNPAVEVVFLAQHLCFNPCGLPRFYPFGQVVTAHEPPGSGPEECIRWVIMKFSRYSGGLRGSVSEKPPQLVGSEKAQNSTKFQKFL